MLWSEVVVVGRQKLTLYFTSDQKKRPLLKTGVTSVFSDGTSSTSDAAWDLQLPVCITFEHQLHLVPQM